MPAPTPVDGPFQLRQKWIEDLAPLPVEAFAKSFERRPPVILPEPRAESLLHGAGSIRLIVERAPAQAFYAVCENQWLTTNYLTCLFSIRDRMRQNTGRPYGLSSKKMKDPQKCRNNLHPAPSRHLPLSQVRMSHDGSAFSGVMASVPFLFFR